MSDELVTLELALGRAVARVEIPRSALVRTLQLALFNRAGTPVRCETTITRDGDRSVQARLGDGRNVLIPVSPSPLTFDGPDTPVHALPAPPRRIGIVTATEDRPGIWKSRFTANEDCFVTHFVLGRPGAVEYAGAFEGEPPLLWAGHTIKIGIVTHAKGLHGETSRGAGTRHYDSRGRLTTRDDAGRLSSGGAAAGHDPRSDPTAHFARAIAGAASGLAPRAPITDPARLLSAKGVG
jgi:hypothetical protein